MKKNDSKNEFISLLGRFFTEYLPVSVNASSNTIASYKCAFRLLFQYLNEETDIKIGHITFEALDFELLTKYFDWLITTRQNSRTTAKQRLAALASFADYSESRNLEAGYIFKNSLKKISKKTFRKVKRKATLFFHPERIGNPVFSSRYNRKTWLERPCPSVCNVFQRSACTGNL